MGYSLGYYATGVNEEKLAYANGLGRVWGKEVMRFWRKGVQNSK